MPIPAHTIGPNPKFALEPNSKVGAPHRLTVSVVQELEIDMSEVYVVAYIEVLAARSDAAADVIRHHAAVCAQELGEVGFRALTRAGHPGQFALLETWSGEAARSAHVSSSHVGEFRNGLEPLLAAPYDERVHAPLSVTGYSGKSGGFTYVITHIDVTPPNTDEGATLVTAHCEATRSEDGNAGCVAFSQSGRPNHMSLVETWENTGARHAHTGRDATIAFRRAIAPLSGALYDERVYEALT